MTQGGSSGRALAEYARAHGLTPVDRADLPATGGLLGRDGLKQDAAASGVLPGGETGTLCHLTYAVRSDDSTRTERRSAVVIRVPESIGFAPYLASAGAELSGAVGRPVRSVELEGGGRLRADRGIDETWLTELLSPAFTHWLQRSPDDFNWELADGVLTVSRSGHLTDETRLTELCADAARIAMAVREEALEDVETGEAGRTAADATEPDSDTRIAKGILDRTTFGTPPTDVVAARAQFRELTVRHPTTYLTALAMTLGWMLVANIIGGGIFGLLLNLPNPGRAVLIFEICLFLIIGFFCLRRQINGISSKLASEGFWREYARNRNLRFEDPRRFAAEHAKAGLPGTPTRVMTGTFDGVPGSLMITGDGLKRGDAIALVGGPDGPIATEEFDVSAPGPSARALDSYASKLAVQLRPA